MARSLLMKRSLIVRYLLLTITILSCSNLVSFSKAIKGAKVFNVLSYGAIADGKTDNSKAFLKAWKEACEWNGLGRVLVPNGRYMLYPIVFEGPCKSQTRFTLKQSTTLLAPNEEKVNYPNNIWISFHDINDLNVGGLGTLDGQGASSWHRNDCNTNPNCPQLPTSISFNFVKNGKIHHLTSINSKNTHFSFNGCENLNLTKLSIFAPADSPNTDGIKIGSSKSIYISRSIISTGDDCIALLSGNNGIYVSGSRCGPGHGISVGSLGKYKGEEDMRGITVRNCTLKGTDNGVRIKSWQTDFASTAEDFLFEDIVMENVRNPITIDQKYCPFDHPCSKKTSSHVQIENVKFINIRGSSSSEIAINLLCSAQVPCKDIVLGNINIVSNNPKNKATSFCSNVNGRSFGRQSPPPCV